MASEILQDVLLSELILDGKKLDINATEAITDATLNRTITGASTIDFTFHDPDKAILISGIFDVEVDLQVDDFKFALVKVDKSGYDLSVTVEDWAVAQLRKITKPMKANRAKMTRAQFAKSIVDKVDGVDFFCPELKKKQPIAKASDLSSTAQADKEKQFGFAKDSGIQVKEQAATEEQKKNINIVLQTGKSMGAPDWVLIASIATIIDESSAINLKGGDRDSVGVFQQRASWGTVAQRRDVANAANSFFASAISAASSGGFPLKNYALLATKVQNPQVFSQGTNSTYFKAVDRWVAEAITIYEAWSGADVPGGVPSKGTKIYEFHLGGAGHLKETGWDCLVRLANEVDWRCYSIGSTIYFLPDRDLYTARPLDTLREEDDSVDTIDFSMDLGKKVDHATVTCHASRWSIPPGSVILLDNVGKANGRWLVETISRSLFNDQATITLVKPTPAKKEPRATSGSGTSSTTALKHSGDFGGDIVINLARQWIGQTYKGGRSYVFGANHNLTYTQMRDGSVTPPFDCSSLARYCWAKGGHTDIGGDTHSQIAKAKGTKWQQGSNTGPPPGGWLEGDLLFPHDGHVNMSMGDGTMIGAHSPSIGIGTGPEYTHVFFWARPEPGED